MRRGIRRYIERHPRAPIDPAEDRRNAKPWIIAMIASAVIVVPEMIAVAARGKGQPNAILAAGVSIWLALIVILRLVGYLAGRVRRFF